jgi:hypothetical protein
MTVVSGNSRFLRTRFCTGARHKCRAAEEGFHFLGEVNTLMTSSECICESCLLLPEQFLRVCEGRL